MNYKLNLSVLVALGSFTAHVSHSQSNLNTTDIDAYVIDTYFGIEAMEHSRGLFQGNVDAGASLALGYGDFEIEEEEGRRFAADFDLSAASLLYIHDFKSFRVGLSVSAFDTELNSLGTDRNDVTLITEGDGWNVGLGLAKKWERWGVILHAATGEMSSDSIRTNGRINPKAATYDINFYSISLQVKYLLYTGESFDIGSFLEAGYQNVENDGFTETNSPDFVTIKPYNIDASYGELGLIFSYKGSGWIKPSLKLSVLTDLGDSAINYVGINPLKEDFNATVNDPADTLLAAELGFDIKASERFGIRATVGYASGDELNGLTASLIGTYRF